MASAATNLALILLAVFTLIGLAAWYFKTQITVFARILLEQRRKKENPAQTEAPSA